MPQTNTAEATPSELELTITRTFDAPRTMVFKAWTDPRHLMNWWGPRGFTLKSCNLDLRPGGSYRFHMVGPENDDHWSAGVFREVAEPERLVLAGSWTDAEGNPTRPATVMTITFSEQGGKTTLRLHQAVFESVTARDLHHGGWSSSIDKLAEYLATM